MKPDRRPADSAQASANLREAHKREGRREKLRDWAKEMLAMLAGKDTIFNRFRDCIELLKDTDSDLVKLLERGRELGLDLDWSPHGTTYPIVQKLNKTNLLRFLEALDREDSEARAPSINLSVSKE